jgi:hypothetical protein
VSDRGCVLDLRTYKLKPGAGQQFAQILADDALPMLERFGIDVAAYGPSLDDADTYYLVRSFASTAERNERLDAFYGSEEWQTKHRERVLPLLDSFHVLLLTAPAASPGA